MQPESVDTIPPQALTESGPAVGMSMDAYFTDPDGDPWGTGPGIAAMCDTGPSPRGGHHGAKRSMTAAACRAIPWSGPRRQASSNCRKEQALNATSSPPTWFAKLAVSSL